MRSLREWRRLNGITQDRLAAETGIPQTLLSKYERGRATPRVCNALAIARATGGEVPVEAWERQRGEVAGE